MAHDPGPPAQRVGDLLEARGRTLAVAESLTGGELSARFASAPGASAWFRGGLVAYASKVKRELLAVPPGPVVSESAAVAMAEGVARLLGADVSLAVTGAAGPAPQDGCEPGTVWFALHHAGRTPTRFEQIPGSPEEVVDRTAGCAVEWLLSHLLERDQG